MNHSNCDFIYRITQATFSEYTYTGMYRTIIDKFTRRCKILVVCTVVHHLEAGETTSTRRQTYFLINYCTYGTGILKIL